MNEENDEGEWPFIDTCEYDGKPCKRNHECIIDHPINLEGEGSSDICERYPGVIRI